MDQYDYVRDFYREQAREERERVSVEREEDYQRYED